MHLQRSKKHTKCTANKSQMIIYNRPIIAREQGGFSIPAPKMQMKYTCPINATPPPKRKENDRPYIANQIPPPKRKGIATSVFGKAKERPG